MPAMIDLHCDTLTRSRGRTAGRGPLDDPAFHLSLSKVPAGTRWIQCFAIFVPDQLRGRDLGERLLIPVNMLRHGGDVFLDYVRVSGVERELGLPVTVVDQDGFDLLDAMLGRSNHSFS